MEIKRKKCRRQKRQQNTRRVKICGVGVKASNDSLEETHTYVNDTFPHNSTDSSSVTNDYQNDEDAAVSEIGNQDLEMLEMNVYDTYRQEDGKPYSYNYLLDCRAKLIQKLHSCREENFELIKKMSDTKLEQQKKIRRIRQFYELIAFAKSRSGAMVRSAMGTSHNADSIIQDMNARFSA